MNIEWIIKGRGAYIDEESLCSSRALTPVSSEIVSDYGEVCKQL